MVGVAEKQTFPGNLPPAWRARLQAEAEKTYYKKLTKFLVEERKSTVPIFPSPQNVFRAIEAVDYSDVKVLILGQDPYHRPDQAIGLSFAVPNLLFPKPPSLQNIFKEIKSDLGISVQAGSSDLSGWVTQGVLLLNTALTVREGQAFSHQGQGWEVFTDEIIRALNDRADPVVFLLWGAAAQKKKALLTSPVHFILESSHPSPLSAHRGFLGNRHFSKTNAILRKNGKTEIRWGQVSV